VASPDQLTDQKKERWAMNVGDIVALECLGDIPGNRFLDGRTADGTVGLAPNRNIPLFSGTRWRVLNALDNFTFASDISTERRRRLLNRHRVGVSRSVDCITLTDAQKGSLLMAYRRAIQHSTLNFTHPDRRDPSAAAGQSCAAPGPSRRLGVMSVPPSRHSREESPKNDLVTAAANRGTSLPTDQGLP
jgi:hypothetical protein